MLAQVAPLGGACILEVLTVLAKALTLIASLGEPYIPEVRWDAGNQGGN